MSRPTVLIADDETLVRMIAVEEFEDAGYAVIEAADGAEAVEALRSNQPIDLLFTDIRMPGAIDGWEVARIARELRPGIGVIYATGFSAEDLQIVEGGRYFRKPYRLTAVLDTAKELLPPA